MKLAIEVSVTLLSQQVTAEIQVIVVLKGRDRMASVVQDRVSICTSYRGLRLMQDNNRHR